MWESGSILRHHMFRACLTVWLRLSRYKNIFHLILLVVSIFFSVKLRCCCFCKCYMLFVISLRENVYFVAFSVYHFWYLWNCWKMLIFLWTIKKNTRRGLLVWFLMYSIWLLYFLLCPVWHGYNFFIHNPLASFSIFSSSLIIHWNVWAILCKVD